MTFTVGLTGGIGSGKTTVANMFGAKGAGVIDTDEVSRALTGPGQAAMAEIARRFGQEFVTADGSLDRQKMRAKAFGDPAARADLEAILHPLIRVESERRVRESVAPYTVLVVPLLAETGALRKIMSRVAVVDCEPETQIRRVMERSNLSRDEVLAIMAAQISRERRLALADDVIHNDGGLDALNPEIDALHGRYLRLAKAA